MKTEFDEIIEGTSTLPHADKMKAVYDFLQTQGNNPEWQLMVLAVLTFGIQENINRKQRILDKLINN